MLWLATLSTVLAQDVSVVDKPESTSTDASTSDTDEFRDGNRGEGLSSDETEVPGRPQEEARRTYMDRIVAAPMSHLGASWLVRPERQAEENAQQALRT